MYNFDKELIKGEKIIYTGRSISGKGGSKAFFYLIMLGVFIGIFIFLNVFLYEEAFAVVFVKNLLLNIVLLVMIIFIIFLIINREVLKDRRVKNDSFCITNMRVIHHDYKSNNITYGYLDKFNSIHKDFVKDNYGDVRLIYQEQGLCDPEHDLIEMKYSYEETNPEKLVIVLEKIENIDEVVKIISEQMKKILDENGDVKK